MSRLDRALETLVGAIDARVDRESAVVDVEAEIQRMGADRTRLADSLDRAESRARQLEDSNREVSRRLVNAMEAIRAVLDGDG